MTNILILVSLLAIWPFGSGKEYRMTAGGAVPAASGTVNVNRNKDNGNTQLDIKVEHLAKPASLTPASNVYIVWVRPRGEAPVKQGAIGVNNDLNGEMKTVTVSKDFDLFITAEQSENVAMPNGIEVLHTHINLT